MQIGEFECLSLSDGTFRLDGGAMFGVVPKVLWERRAPADDRNRITLALRPLLVRTGRETILIDAGAGDKWTPKALEIYNFDARDGLFGRTPVATVIDLEEPPDAFVPPHAIAKIMSVLFGAWLNSHCRRKLRPDRGVLDMRAL